TRSDRNPVGPRFTIEPPGKVQFYNSTGAVVTCAASGVPLPTMSWIRQDGTPVQEVPELLQIRPDASLVFSPFRPEDFRQDIHSATYRCTASNSVGIIGSRDVNIRAGKLTTRYFCLLCCYANNTQSSAYIFELEYGEKNNMFCLS
ncbi:Down syndrome cell adhesion molecule-like protein Dscam2, partial [Araneus ventricosus]